MQYRGVLLTLTVTLVALSVFARSEHGTPPVRQDEPAQGWEAPTDPPASQATIGQNTTASSPTLVKRNGFASVQVNVAPGGLNIEGDAANEPSIAVDPTAPNRVVIGWRQFDSVSSNFRQAGWAYSHDGGRSWTFPGSLTPGVFRSDPVLAADADGRFFYHSLTSVDQGYGSELMCDLFVSSDGGQSWSEPLFAFGGDKNWMTVDASESSGRGNVYLTWRPGDNHYTWSQGWFGRLVDHGATAGEPVVGYPYPSRGSIAVGPDGEVYAAGAAGFLNAPCVVLRSVDACQLGVDPPTFVQSNVDLGGELTRGQNYGGIAPNPAGMLGQVWVAVDSSTGPRRGWVYLLASVDPPGEDPMDVHFVRSTDGGQTWSLPVRTHDESVDRRAWQWFGTMAVAPNGRIDVAWVETADFQSVNMGELRYASSTDGGESWTEAVSVSQWFDSWLGFPQQAKLGDYYQLVSDDVGAHLAFAATFNGEQDVYYLRIGDWDCNGNGVEDTADLVSGAEQDCDRNEIPDSCEIAAGAALDTNHNGILDRCEQPGPRRPGSRIWP
jgi:hypothetical protein